MLAESILPNAVASIMMIDASDGLLNVMCAPSIPSVGHQALTNLEPGVGGGSCGNAVFHNEGQWCGEIINKHQSGKLVSQWMSITVIKDEYGEIQNYLSIISDLTELKSAQQQVVDMAFYDSVTQLHNKTYLEQQILANEQNYSLLLLNINNFSYINTAYGFNVGDKILTTIANTLANNFSPHETFRLNSDEFGLLFKEKINIAEQIKIIQQYFYNTLIQVDDISLHIAFTYGAAHGKEHLLHNSALALKQAKGLGENRYHI